MVSSEPARNNALRAYRDMMAREAAIWVTGVAVPVVLLIGIFVL